MHSVKESTRSNINIRCGDINQQRGYPEPWLLAVTIVGLITYSYIPFLLLCYTITVTITL